MFSLDNGRLQYEPFATYHLPKILPCRANKATFKARDGQTTHVMKRFQLCWPGEVLGRRDDDLIPTSILLRLVSSNPSETGPPDGEIALRDVVRSSDWRLDAELPDAIAYHLAVNRETYYPDRKCHHPVSGLPPDRVDELLDATMALDKKAVAALEYLRWTAHGHLHHPLLRDFDTNIREELGALNREAAWLYFYLLSDYLYDSEAEYWSRGDKWLWARMATYFHWVGRTGAALPAGNAYLEPTWRSLLETPQDIKDRLEKIRSLGYNQSLETVLRWGRSLGPIVGPVKK